MFLISIMPFAGASWNIGNWNIGNWTIDGYSNPTPFPPATSTTSPTPTPTSILTPTSNPTPKPTQAPQNTSMPTASTKPTPINHVFPFFSYYILMIALLVFVSCAIIFIIFRNKIQTSNER